METKTTNAAGVVSNYCELSGVVVNDGLVWQADQETKGYLVVDLDNPTAPTFCPTVFKKLRTVSSVNDIKADDAYYMVTGSVEEVLKGNKLDSVLRTNVERKEKSAVSYQKLSIVDGLPEFLALNGFDNKYQEFAINWVNQTLNRVGA